MALCPDAPQFATHRRDKPALPGSCGIDLNDGARCDKPVVDGSDVDICAPHALAVFRYLSQVAGERRNGSIDAVGRAQQIPLERFKRHGRGWTCSEIERLTAEIQNGWTSVVYYLLVDQHIKIGYTADITQRMRIYPPSAVVLALEPGARAVEAVRHKQFAEHLAARNEWFHPGDDLLAHIRRLDELGLPPAPIAPRSA